MREHLPRRRAERRGLHLWPVGTVLVLAFATAVFVAAAVFYTGWDLLGARGLKPERRIDSTTLFDLVKLSFGVVAGAGALVALVVAYRRQRVDEDGALREATRLHTERFTTAVSQLGDDSAAVRLGGVHALAGLADDAPTRDLRQTCIDVLCAYLRLPYTAEADLPADDAEARHRHLGLREVRHTVIRLIGNRLRLSANHPHSWQGLDFDFTGVVFDGGDLGGAVFSGGTVSFNHAVFSGGTVTFRNAVFSGAKVYLAYVEFSAGLVSFYGAQFSGGSLFFGDARFAGAEVNFRFAVFSGANVSFIRSVVSGGTVDFRDAVFSGERVPFRRQAVIYGGVVNFREVEFSGGTVDFRDAVFSGSRVYFDGAGFSGSTVIFQPVQISGGRVDFSSATGDPPPGLVRQDRIFPNGLLWVPPAWHPDGS